jgi:hypothetical protein
MMDGGSRFSRDLVESLKKEDVETKVMATEKIEPLLNFFKIRKIFKNSDIIHAVDIWPSGFYAWFISFGLKKPIIIDGRNLFNAQKVKEAGFKYVGIGQ